VSIFPAVSILLLGYRYEYSDPSFIHARLLVLRVAARLKTWLPGESRTADQSSNAVIPSVCDSAISQSAYQSDQKETPQIWRLGSNKTVQNLQRSSFTICILPPILLASSKRE